MRTVSCAECGTEFQTKSPRAKFCPDKPGCRKAASRRPSKTGRREKRPAAAPRDRHPALPAVWTQAEVLEELDAAAELLEGDLDTLEARYPQGVDPVMDELIGGLATHAYSLERLRDFVVTRCGSPDDDGDGA